MNSYKKLQCQYVDTKNNIIYFFGKYSKILPTGETVSLAYKLKFKYKENKYGYKK